VAADVLQIYSLRSSSGYLKRIWDDECVVYVADARETHLLTAPCAHVLGLLEQGPVSSEMLNSELGLLLEGAQDQEVADLVCEIVTTLAKIGLVQSSEDAS
jgi:PqqD family protein of HPr-rel-A system